jgi:hypothetical protein
MQIFEGDTTKLRELPKAETLPTTRRKAEKLRALRPLCSGGVAHVGPGVMTLGTVKTCSDTGADLGKNPLNGAYFLAPTMDNPQPSPNPFPEGWMQLTD